MPLNKTPLTDESPMPFGKHKGVAMGKVPGDYLQWLSEQKWIPDWPAVHTYLKANAKEITREADEIRGERADLEGFDSYEDYKANG